MKEKNRNVCQSDLTSSWFLWIDSSPECLPLKLVTEFFNKSPAFTPIEEEVKSANRHFLTSSVPFYTADSVFFDGVRVVKEQFPSSWTESCSLCVLFFSIFNFVFFYMTFLFYVKNLNEIFIERLKWKSWILSHRYLRSSRDSWQE